MLKLKLQATHALMVIINPGCAPYHPLVGQPGSPTLPLTDRGKAGQSPVNDGDMTNYPAVSRWQSVIIRSIYWFMSWCIRPSP